MPSRFSGGFSGILRWVIFRWLAYVLTFFAIIALFEHLVLRSSTFAFILLHVLILFGFALFGLFEALAGFLAPRIVTRDRRELLAFSIYAAITVLLLVIFRVAGVSLTTTLFRWEWPITALIALGAIALWGLRLRSAR